MERKQVDSSMIRSVGFENGIIEVEFKGNGKVYQYPATEEEYKAFLNAPSLGKHLNQHFKGRK